jgi:hypothetical protein
MSRRRWLLAIILGGLAGLTASQPAPVQAASVSSASINGCVAAIRATGQTTLTVAEAERCTDNAPVYSFSSPPADPPSGVYVVVNGSAATINQTEANTSAAPTAAPGAITAASCWWQYGSDSTSWWDVNNGGTLSGGGYSNHCGYGNMTTMNFSHWCYCSGYDITKGSYDSNYGARCCNYPYATAWANYTMSLALLEWTSYVRLYHNSSNYWWGWEGA